MTARRIAAETLIDLAIATLETEIRPTLAREQRYAMAMTINALRIARREILTDGETPLWDLLDTVYPDGAGTAAQLADDIAVGEVHDGAPPDLEQRLKDVLIAELRVRNPAFLKSRGIDG
ncbi:MAG: DUF6285 domain-containing protein [Pseudomonadota bacterium]